MSNPVTWNDIQNLGIDGKTDAEIASILQAVTRDAIAPQAARTFLREQELWMQTKTGMSGAIEDATIPAPMEPLFDKFWSAIYGGGADKLGTNAATYAVDFHTGVSGLVALGAMTADQATAWYDLGGGRPWVATVEADVTALRAANTAQAAIDDAKRDKSGVVTDAADKASDTVQADPVNATAQQSIDAFTTHINANWPS